MKFAISTLILAVLFISCEGKKETETKVEGKAAESDAMPAAERKECFRYAVNKDTVTMTLTRNANNASGEMQYNLFEKDGNFGTFSGTFIGDTLYADYTFESEGMKSVREAVFLRKGDKMFQGDGEIIITGDKVTYRNPKALSFGNSIVLEKVECKN